MRRRVAFLLVTFWQNLVTAGNLVVIVVLEVCRGEFDPRRSFFGRGVGVGARDYGRGAVGAAAETVDEGSLR